MPSSLPKGIFFWYFDKLGISIIWYTDGTKKSYLKEFLFTLSMNTIFQIINCETYFEIVKPPFKTTFIKTKTHLEIIFLSFIHFNVYLIKNF